MKIRSVTCKNHEKAFHVRFSKGPQLLPYSKVNVRPSGNDPVARVYVDMELGGEGFS